MEQRPTQEVRYLPPGAMREYWEQFQQLEALGQVSFSLFWKVWKTEFAHLKFRGTSSHAVCSTCLHHKMLLKELSPYLYARKQQAVLFHAHLVAQYRDRQVYWALRGSSRVR